MDHQKAEEEVHENKTSGLFSLPAALLKKLYSNPEQSYEHTQDQLSESEFVEQNRKQELSEVCKSLLSLISHTKKLFHNDEAFDSVKKLVFEINDPIEENHVLIALTSVIKNLSSEYVVENKDLIFELPLDILKRFKFSNQYRKKSSALQEKCKNVKSVKDLNSSLQAVYELFYSVYQDAYSDKEELENFLFNIGAQISRIGDKLYAVTEEQVSDLKLQSDLNSKMNDTVILISNNIISGNDLSSLKNTVKEQLDSLQNIVEEERKIVKAQEARIQNNVKALANKVNKLKLEAQELRNKVKREKEQALRDPLTGLYNRQAYNDKLVELIEVNDDEKKNLSLLIWDIDHFKKFNDQYGHVVGDKVLKAVAEKLSHALKDEYFLARYGGEEFAMLLPGLTLEDSEEFADQVRNEVSGITFLVKGKQIKITISCGITNLQEGDNAQAMFERADRALYAAKEDGRNRVKVSL